MDISMAFPSPSLLPRHILRRAPFLAVHSLRVFATSLSLGSGSRTPHFLLPNLVADPVDNVLPSLDDPNVGRKEGLQAIPCVPIAHRTTWWVVVASDPSFL